MQIADFGDLGFQRHVIIGIFGELTIFRIQDQVFDARRLVFRIQGCIFGFPGFDYEFQTLGATEPPRFSEQYESSGFLSILITLIIQTIQITPKDISLCQRARVFRKTMQRYNIFSALCDLERLRAT